MVSGVGIIDDIVDVVSECDKSLKSDEAVGDLCIIGDEFIPEKLECAMDYGDTGDSRDVERLSAGNIYIYIYIYIILLLS